MKQLIALVLIAGGIASAWLLGTARTDTDPWDQVVRFNIQEHGSLDAPTKAKIYEASSWVCSTMLPDIVGHYGQRYGFLTTDQAMAVLADGFYVLVDSGLSSDQATSTFYSAIRFGCPEYDYLMDLTQ